MKSLRIIHVTNFGFKPVKVYFHNTGTKLSNGWIRAGHHVINFSDRDIARWQAFMGYRRWGISSVNRLLLNICKNTKPDIVAFGHADLITNETIAQIRADFPKVKMLQWNIDWAVPSGHAMENDPTSDNNKKRLINKSALLDATFITTGGNAIPEIPTFFMPNPVDISIEQHHNFKAHDLPFDVFFASNSNDDKRHHCGQWQEMGEFCSNMATALPEMDLLLPGINGAPKVFGPDYQEAMGQCRIGLNISRRNDIYLYSSDRLAHMIGNGLVVCIDRASGYNDIFSDEEMIFYSSEDELFKKLRQLKNNDDKRRLIAERGWKRYTTLFNSTEVSKYMLDVLFGRTSPMIESKKETT